MSQVFPVIVQYYTCGPIDRIQYYMYTCRPIDRISFFEIRPDQTPGRLLLSKGKGGS